MQNQRVGSRSPVPGARKQPRQALCVNHLPDDKYAFRERTGLGVLITSGHSQSLYLVTFPQEGTHCSIKKKKKKKRNSIQFFSFAKLKQNLGLWFCPLLLL